MAANWQSLNLLMTNDPQTWPSTTGEIDSPLCPCCHEYTESCDCVLTCSHSQAFCAMKFSILATHFKSKLRMPDIVPGIWNYSWEHGKSDPIWPRPAPMHTDFFASYLHLHCLPIPNKNRMEPDHQRVLSSFMGRASMSIYQKQCFPQESKVHSTLMDLPPCFSIPFVHMLLTNVINAIPTSMALLSRPTKQNTLTFSSQTSQLSTKTNILLT